MFDYANRLKELRTIFGFTQRQLAEKSAIDEKHYGRLERQENVPTIDTIEKICKGMGIPIVMFYMPSLRTLKNDNFNEFEVQKIKALNFAHEIDIHFNCDVLKKGCNLCVWYSGFIATASLDEYELKLSADGNIRANIYVDHQEAASINCEDASSILSEYYKDDDELKSCLEREDFSQRLLDLHSGNVIFMPESNWLTLTLTNNSTGEVLDVFNLDTDNIYEPFSNKEGDLIDFLLPQNRD